MDVVILILMFLLGAVFGSFACCQASRLRMIEGGGVGRGGRRRELALAHSAWSVCLSCGRRLKWYDNIPILSWVFLRGKCRRCGKGIGWWEIGSEMGLAVVFAGVFCWFSLGDMGVREWVLLLLMLAMAVGFAVLFISDARWGRLPVRYLTFCAICAILYVATREWGVFSVARIWDFLGALMVLPVLYYLLYKVSKERWVGNGDWLLALPMALVLGDFWLAFFCLFLANLMGCIVMVPVMMMRGKDTNMRIAFGPFLVVAFLVVFLGRGVIFGLL